MSCSLHASAIVFKCAVCTSILRKPALRHYCFVAHVDSRQIEKGDTTYLDEDALNPGGDHQSPPTIASHQYQRGKSHPISIVGYKSSCGSASAAKSSIVSTRIRREEPAEDTQLCRKRPPQLPAPQLPASRRALPQRSAPAR